MRILNCIFYLPPKPFMSTLRVNILCFALFKSVKVHSSLKHALTRDMHMSITLHMLATFSSCLLYYCGNKAYQLSEQSVKRELLCGMGGPSCWPLREGSSAPWHCAAFTVLGRRLPRSEADSLPWAPKLQVFNSVSLWSKVALLLRWLRREHRCVCGFVGGLVHSYSRDI